MRRTATAAMLLACMAATAARAQGGEVTTCVIRGGELVPLRVAAGDFPAFLDSLRRADAASGVRYAPGKAWFAENEPMMLNGWRGVKYGMPRVVDPALLRPAGVVDGIPVFAEAESMGPHPEVVYVPTRAGCEFQAYSFARDTWPVLPPPEGARLVCVVRDGALAEEPRYASDTAYTHAPVPEPGPGYALRERWFVDNEPLVFAGARITRYGLPRILGIDEVEKVGEFRGVGVYVERGASVPSPVYYLPVRPGCEFQPYQNVHDATAIRG